MKKLFVGILIFIITLQIGTSGSVAMAMYTEDPQSARLCGDNSNDLYNMSNNNIFCSNSSLKMQSNPKMAATYIHDTRFSNCDVISGIDVSKYQGTIDWNKVKAAGVNFAFIRVGYRNYSQGYIGEDEYYHRNIQAAVNAGINVGVYFFSQAITEAEAVEEANYTLSKLNEYRITMPVVIDYEYGKVNGTKGGRLYDAGLTREKATDVCEAFCKTVSAAGYKPMVYANASMLNSNLNAERISEIADVWLAHYSSWTYYGGKYSIWQYSSNGSVDGIKGKVDCNFWYKTKDNVVSAESNQTIPNEVKTNIVDISSCEMSKIPSQKYTGTEILPEITVKNGNDTLVRDTDYKLAYSDNQDIGTATVEATGIGNYTGTVSITFDIMPPKSGGLKVVSSGTNQIKLGWTKINNVTGYKIYRAATRNGAYRKVKTTSGNAVVTWTDTKLAASTKYYYKIRAYKTVNQEYEGEYSALLTAQTKAIKTLTAITNSTAKLKKMPGVSYSNVLILPKGAKLAIVSSTKDKNGNRWYLVKCVKGNKTSKGYVIASRVSVK